MADQGSISKLLAALRTGDSKSQQELFVRCFTRSTPFADRQLSRYGASGREVGGEDIAQSAIFVVLRKLNAGEYPKVVNSNQLWALLFRVLKSKAWKQARREGAQIRGGGKVRGDSAFRANDDSARRGLNDIPSSGTGPLDVDELAAMMDWYLESQDQDIRETVLLDLQGFSNREIADMLGCALSAVERRLRVARAALRKHLKE